MNTKHVLPSTRNYNRLVELSQIRFASKNINRRTIPKSTALSNLRDCWIDLTNLYSDEHQYRLNYPQRTFNSWCKGMTLKTKLKISDLCSILSFTSNSDVLQPYQLFFRDKTSAYAYEHQLIIDIIEKAQDLAIEHVHHLRIGHQDFKKCIESNWGDRPIDLMQLEIFMKIFQLSEFYTSSFGLSDAGRLVSQINHEELDFFGITDKEHSAEIHLIEKLFSEMKLFWSTFLEMFDYPNRYPNLLDYLDNYAEKNNNELVEKIMTVANQNWSTIVLLGVPIANGIDNLQRRINYYNEWPDDALFSLPELEKSYK